MAAEVALARNLATPGTPLILYAWQNILRQRRWLVRLACAFTLRSAQHVVCASREAISVLERQGYRGTSSIQPLFGLDTRYFYPHPVPALKAQLGLKEFVVGYIGRLVPEKGVDTLLKAAALAQRPLQVLVVGSGPEKEKLQALARQLGIQSKCVFVENRAYDLIADYVNALDLLILPSRTTPNWKEQFGRVLVEAMASKVPIVGSNSGAIPEVIGEAGRIFPEGETLALVQIIDELAAQPALRGNLIERGYQRVQQHYTVDQLAQKTLTLWRNLASESIERPC